MSGRKWDLTSTHSLEAAAEYLRKNANDALLVLVVRVDDSAIACHPDVAPRDAMDRLLLEAVQLTNKLNFARLARQEKAAARAAKLQAKGQQG